MAMSRLAQKTIWLAVHRVSLSPSQAAMEACGSIITCAWSGVVYVASSFTGAEANAPAKSPTAVSGGPPVILCGLALPRAASRSKAPGERA